MDPATKVAQTISVFKMISLKKPEQQNQVFAKGMNNLGKHLVVIVNGFLLSMGSVDSSKAYQQDKR